MEVNRQIWCQSIFWARVRTNAWFCAHFPDGQKWAILNFFFSLIHDFWNISLSVSHGNRQSKNIGQEVIKNSSWLRPVQFGQIEKKIERFKNRAKSNKIWRTLDKNDYALETKLCHFVAWKDEKKARVSQVSLSR